MAEHGSPRQEAEERRRRREELEGKAHVGCVWRDGGRQGERVLEGGLFLFF